MFYFFYFPVLSVPQLHQLYLIFFFEYHKNMLWLADFIPEWSMQIKLKEVDPKNVDLNVGTPLGRAFMNCYV